MTNSFVQLLQRLDFLGNSDLSFSVLQPRQILCVINKDWIFLFRAQILNFLDFF